MRPIGTAEELERRRRRAVELLPRGESPPVLARILGVCRTSRDRWRARAQPAPRALAAPPPPGPKPRLSAEQIRDREGLLLHGATAQGWPKEWGSVPRVAQVIRRPVGVEYPVAHVRQISRRRRPWSSQKPPKKAKPGDDETIAP